MLSEYYSADIQSNPNVLQSQLDIRCVVKYIHLGLQLNMCDKMTL